MRNTLLFLLLFLPTSAVLGSNETDSLLNVLDRIIKERPLYAAAKEHRINDMKKHLQDASSDDEKYDLLGGLLQEYKGYQIDSALRIANERMEIAQRQHSEKNSILAKRNLSEAMSMTGLDYEALDFLK
jgi:hypothetical protein